jgi:putative transposase
MSQCPALNREQPMLPMGLGMTEASREIVSATAPSCCLLRSMDSTDRFSQNVGLRYGHQEFLEYLRRIDQSASAELDIQCSAYNSSSHEHLNVKASLAARPRWQMHFIPTCSSWLDQVERFFSIITYAVIRRGSSRSAKELTSKTDPFVTRDNKFCKPLIEIEG